MGNPVQSWLNRVNCALKMGDQMTLRGTLQGHGDSVTQIATTPQYPDMILSASRDKTLIMWKLTRDETNYGVPQRSLRGHNHFVSDVVMSSDGQFALSGSWDHSLRLWDLSTGQTTRQFRGHTKDVLSVAFSADNRQIVSGSRDKTIKLWNTLGVCKYTIQVEDGHSDWVSCVRFSPNRYWLCAATGPSIQIWDLEGKAIVDEVRPEVFNTSSRAEPPQCISLAWSSDGQTLFAGYTDNMIRVWQVSMAARA